MKGRSFFDRMSAKTVTSLLCAHLEDHYRLSPAAARALSADLLRHAQLLDQSGRRDGQVVYQAIALGEPPGKPLSACRKLPVRLTLFDPSDMELRRDGSPREVTERVMLRIAREAVEQGGALSIEDVAWLLRMSAATVKRYRKRMLAGGAELRLRGDLSDAGPGSTHRDRIVKLFLLGYSETEIALRTNHRLECVEEYVYDFLRVGLLRREGRRPGTICRLVKLSLWKVRAIVELHDALREDEAYAEPVDHWLRMFAVDRRMKKGGLTG